jgi:hypothetical protein
MIKIILFLVVIIIIIYYSNNSQCNYKKEPFQYQKYNGIAEDDNIEISDTEGTFGSNSKCNLDIDNLYILDRNKEYSKYINKLINNNDNINYTEDEIKIMKNKHQFYNINNNNNISNLVLGECKNSYGDGDAEGTFGGSEDVNVDMEGGYDVGGGSYYGINSNVSGGYNSDIKASIKGAGTYSKGALGTIGSAGSVGLMNNDECINDGYLTDYYYDLEGNNIKSTLKEYINSDENNKCEPVKYNKVGNGSGSSMIIPDQYDINKNLTNAYDIDWSKVINPLTIY